MSQCDGPSMPDCLALDRSTVPSPQQTLLKTICEVPSSARVFLAYIHAKGGWKRAITAQQSLSWALATYKTGLSVWIVVREMCRLRCILTARPRRGTRVTRSD